MLPRSASPDKTDMRTQKDPHLFDQSKPNFMQKHSTKEACSEVAILGRLNHPNIIKLLEFFTD